MATETPDTKVNGINYDAVQTALTKVREGMRELETLLPDEIVGTVSFRSREEYMNPHTMDCAEAASPDTCCDWIRKALSNGIYSPTESRARE